MKVQYTEDGKTEFVYAIDAPYAGTLELKGDDMLLQDFSKKTEEVSPEDDSTPETVTEVYYMSAEARKKSLELTELEVKGCSGENCGRNETGIEADMVGTIE